MLTRQFTLYFVAASILILFVLDCSTKRRTLTHYEFGGNFTLTTHNNKIFNLGDIKGKIALLFFGYTYCPDACPTALHRLQTTFALLDKEDIDKIQILFVSVDPKRDTKKQLKSYLESYKIGILGLTGKEKEINKVVKQYKAIYKKNFSGSKLGYLIDHTSYIYLIDQKGTVRYLFKHNQTKDSIADTIKQLL